MTEEEEAEEEEEEHGDERDARRRARLVLVGRVTVVTAAGLLSGHSDEEMSSQRLRGWDVVIRPAFAPGEMPRENYGWNVPGFGIRMHLEE